MSLSILCVTRAEPHSVDFLARMAALAVRLSAECIMLVDGSDVHSSGYIESVLDEAVARCSGDYVLRLDDDERCSEGMEQWLAAREYEKAPHWKFARANLWGDEQTLMLTPHLWPDHQTRLSVKVKAGGRRVIHSGSPHGGGELAPVMIEHHKFLVKSAEERRAIVRRYDSVQSGAGTNFLPWSVPEDYYEKVLLASVGDGTVRAWADDELKAVSLRQSREVAA